MSHGSENATTVAAEAVFEAGDVRVTRTLVRVGGASYPVNSIGSVMVLKPKRAALLVSGGLALLIGLVAIQTFGVLLLLIGAALLLVAFLLPHRLMIRTASANQQALSSRDRTFLFSVKQAIETAVALRG